MKAARNAKWLRVGTVGTISRTRYIHTSGLVARNAAAALNIVIKEYNYANGGENGRYLRRCRLIHETRPRVRHV